MTYRLEVLARLRSPLSKFVAPDLRVVERFDLPSRGRGDLVRIQLPAGQSTAEAIVRLSRDDRFEYVTSNDVRKAAMSNDPRGSELWGLGKIGLQQAWQRTTGSREGAPIADARHRSAVGPH